MPLSPGSPQFPLDPNGPAATFAAAVVRLAATGADDVAAVLIGAHHVLMKPWDRDPAKHYEVHVTLHEPELELIEERRETIEEALDVVSGFSWKIVTNPVAPELIRLRQELNRELRARHIPEVLDVRYRDRPGGGSHHVAVHRSTTDWDSIREVDDVLFKIGGRQTAWVQQHGLDELMSPPSTTDTSSSDPPVVFVSYSIADEKYVDELMEHLAPIRRNMADVWTFRKVDAGDDHHQVISDHLRKSAFGILMISAKFLASDYVANVEMPKLTTGGKRLFAVIVGECDHAYITSHLFAPWGLGPLNAMNEPERNRIYTQVSVALRQALSSES